MTRKRLYVSFLLFLTLNTLALMVCETLTNKNIEHKANGIALINTLEMWSGSSAFLSLIYDFNLKSLTEEAKSILNRSPLKACIIIELESFSKLNEETEFICSNGLEMQSVPLDLYSVTRNTIKIGSRDMGEISYIVPIVSSRLSSILFTFIEAIFFAALQLSVIFFVNKKLTVNSSLPIANNAPLQEETKAVMALSNIKKIMDKNKNTFTVNDQIILACYEHPYTVLHKKNGKEDLIRCSLSELENSFPIEFIRVNRSTLFNKEYFYNDVLVTHEKSKMYLLIGKEKNMRKVEVGKQYESKILFSQLQEEI